MGEMSMTKLLIPRFINPRLLLLFAALLSLVTASLPASAHSALRRSSPADGAVLTQGPAEIRLIFNEAIEPRFSAIDIVGPQGRVAAGTLRSDRQNEIAVALPGLAPGRYDVKWRTISADSHKVQGRLRFELRP
jgi:methionine-rich copper-binding protein CopC